MKVVKDIKELAEILNLSITTISRVLNGKSKQFRISEATCRKVLDAAKLYNYTPNRYARGLKITKTGIVGLIIPDVSNPFFADFAMAVETELKNLGYMMILCDSRDDIDMEKQMILLLKSHQVDGIIIAPVGTASEHIRHCYDSGTPLVTIDRVFPELNIPFITSDNFQGAYDATRYLISMGHTSIGFLQGIPESRVNRERRKGYLKALEDHGLSPRKSWIRGDNYSIQSGYVHTRRLFRLKNKPTALLAASNLISLGSIRALKEMRINVPADISLISFDDNPYSEFLWVPMTTINQNKKEMGNLAVNMLIKYIDREADPTDEAPRIYLKTDLIYRNSVLKI